MSYLWICPLVLDHVAHHRGDGTCAYRPLVECAADVSVGGNAVRHALARTSLAWLSI